jgi:hypothetical protein
MLLIPAPVRDFIDRTLRLRLDTMKIRARISRAGVLLTSVFLMVVPASKPRAAAQSVLTLDGEWLMVSSAIDGQDFSRMGNTLGFPDRDMIFQEDGDLRTGVVLREDVGQNVRPLGVWRISGNTFSATFELWCPDPSPTCGSVVMRGEFLREDRVRGTMTVFFDTADPTRPTGLDTWVFNFRGDRVSSGSN